MSDEQTIVDMDDPSEEDCCGDCCERGSTSCSDCIDARKSLEEAENQKMLERQYIKHPFADKFMPIAVIESGMKTYIGGIAELYEASCILVNPVLYREMVTQEGSLQIGMQVPYMTLGCIDDFQIKYDSIYILLNSRPQDMRLASSYEENYSQTRIGESGLVTPTQEDLIQIARG